MKKDRSGIQSILDSLLKSEEPEKLEEEETVESEENIEVEEEQEEEIEKSEEADEIEEEVEEAEEEPAEEPEGETVELDFDELVSSVSEKVLENLTDGVLGERLSKIEDNIGRLIDVANMQNEAAEEQGVEAEEMEKSLRSLEKKLEEKYKLRKSVSNTRIVDKFEEPEKTIDDLSKSEKASILADEIEAGNRRISSKDVITAELGGALSQSAVDALNRHLGK